MERVISIKDYEGLIIVELFDYVDTNNHLTAKEKEIYDKLKELLDIL